LASASPSTVAVIGGGLAGTEAAYQLGCRGVRVDLYEMRPRTPTAAHRTDHLAELVCSNSLRSDRLDNAHGLLKEEMRRLGSLVIEAALASRVPAGSALAVDRDRFAAHIGHRLASLPSVTLHREEMPAIPPSGIAIVASGPLTSEALSRSIAEFTGRAHLYFYDAISPVVEADTIDEEKVFRASRYGKGGDDYVNCPMNEEDYRRFYEALLAAAPVELNPIDKALYFEGCLPIEVMARRGYDTLRFGPMKPVGLIDPRTGQKPYAVVQLRQDDLAASLWNVVGFQNQLKWSEQKHVLRLIPGLEHAEFSRFGMIHRNTYIHAPSILRPTFQTRTREDLFFAGQISGVEGYTESAASGLLAGINAAALVAGASPVVPPRTTALGSLAYYISHSPEPNYQPTNAAFGLLPPLDRHVRGKRERNQALVERALLHLDVFRSELDAGSLALGPGRLARARG